MPRCPSCGSWIWLGPVFGGKTVCKHCGAILVKKSGPRVLDFLVELEAVGNAWDEERGLPFDHVARSEQAFQRLYGDQIRDAAETQSKPEEKLREQTQRVAPSTQADKTGGRCSHCGGTITLSSANFCPRCGARIRGGARTEITPPTGMRVRVKRRVSPKGQVLEDCMVCSLQLNQGDDIVWCPHCGRLAHRDHLVEWIRMKRRRPICGRELQEDQYT